ncbi:cellulase CEL6B [Clavulina sp. PMI_390]|nr:cellulase CEL6B [Clavulina sp. PMI_390]
MVGFLSVAVAGALLGVASAQSALYGQCGGIGWTGATTCVSGATCTYENAYYSQCLPSSSSSTTTTTTSNTSKATGTSTTTSKSSSTTTSTSATSSSSSSPPTDDPYTGYTVYLSPYYAAEIAAAVKNISDSTLATKAAAVANVPTFTWLDTAAKVPTLGTYLADAQSKQTSTGNKYLVQIVIYDLPDRDCAAAASNGEYSIADNGAALYKEYIDAIAAQISAYPNVRVVAVWEPDSLANMVTNLSVAKCANAQSTYEALAVYSWQTLTMSNLYIYVDAGHAGWLGWPANITPAAQLFGNLLSQAGSNTRIRGLATNVANYNSLTTSSPDPITSGDANYDELLYIEALSPLLAQYSFPQHFIVDQGRSGVQNIRNAWGDWCNVNNAGFGMRPTTNTGSSYIDAIVWVKPGGECDGTSNTSSTRYDYHCGLSDAKQPAPEAGTWFQDYFTMLVTNAVPSF